MATPRCVILDIQIFAFFPTQLFCVLLVNLINTDYFPKQHSAAGLYNSECLGTEFYIYNSIKFSI